VLAYSGQAVEFSRLFVVVEEGPLLLQPQEDRPVRLAAAEDAVQRVGLGGRCVLCLEHVSQLAVGWQETEEPDCACRASWRLADAEHCSLRPRQGCFRVCFRVCISGRFEQLSPSQAAEEHVWADDLQGALKRQYFQQREQHFGGVPWAVRRVP